MLASPMNNQDMLQRADVLSDMRNHEANRVLGDMGHAVDHMRKKEALQEHSVQKTENAELDPDGRQEHGSGQGEKEGRHGRERLAEEGTPMTPPHGIAGDHLDILA